MDNAIASKFHYFKGLLDFTKHYKIRLKISCQCIVICNVTTTFY